MRSIRSLNPNDYSRNRLFQENQAKDCQEIEELRRICCEETDLARQARTGEMSMHQERNKTNVSQLLTPIQDLQNKVNSLSQLWSDPRSQSTLCFSESGSMPYCDSGLPHDTRNIVGTSGKRFLNDFLLEKDELLLSSTMQRIWHPLLTN